MWSVRAESTINAVNVASYWCKLIEPDERTNERRIVQEKPSCYHNQIVKIRFCICGDEKDGRIWGAYVSIERLKDKPNIFFDYKTEKCEDFLIRHA